LASAQGGARFNATTRRVDWSISTYRGFRPFGVYTTATSPDALALFVPIHRYPRFTMIGGDMETVFGAWGVRAEAAAFVEDTLQAPDSPFDARDGRSLDAGAGVDRKAGDYRISGSVVVHHESDARDARPRIPGRTDTSLILSADRSFARERYGGRMFGVYNPSSRSAFLRGIATAKLRDDLALEGSVGWFRGRGVDIIGRFADSDFAYARVKYYF
jgi:hypothetical protein